MKYHRLHTPSLLAGLALAALVAVATAQQLVGSPTVEVRVVEAPKPDIRTLPAPPLNGTVQYIVQPGEAVYLNTALLQCAGDPANVDGSGQPTWAAYTLSVNGSKKRTVSVPATDLKAESFNAVAYRSQAGDVLTFGRIPYGGSKPEAPPNFEATIVFKVEHE